MKQYYKLAQMDGWDAYTGETINYRDNIGKVIELPKLDKYELCSAGIMHASEKPNDCFYKSHILPVSFFLVEGTPVIEDENKAGFIQLKILKEIPQNKLNDLLDWNYTEACNPINPLLIDNTPTKKDWDNLHKWASVGASIGASVWDSVRDSVRDSVGASVRNSVGASVRDSVRASVRDSVGASIGASVWDSVRDSVWASAWASVGAYIGSFFISIKEWRYCNFEYSGYPFQPTVDLWKRGFIPLFVKDKWCLWNKKNGVMEQKVDK